MTGRRRFGYRNVAIRLNGADHYANDEPHTTQLFPEESPRSFLSGSRARLCARGWRREGTTKSWPAPQNFAAG